MKWLIIILTVLVAGFLLFLMQQGKASQTGVARGFVNQQLTSCPTSPNCVSTVYPDDKAHYLEPLVFSPGRQGVIDRSADIIKRMGGVITLQNNYYLSATFTSKVFGFVDDVELHWDNTKNTLHLRSASRVGYNDMNANRDRAVNFFRYWQQ